MAAYANVAVTPSTMTNLDDYAYANLDDEEFIELEAYTIVKDMIEDAFDDTKMGDPDVIMRACFIMDSAKRTVYGPVPPGTDLTSVHYIYLPIIFGSSCISLSIRP